MKRRLFLKAGSAMLASSTFPASLHADSTPQGSTIMKIHKTKEEWRKTLSSEAFDVLRNHGTERAFSSPLNQEKREGTYLCAGCELPLFHSSAKFDSGTGWPSFFTAIREHIETQRDFSMIFPRTEYHCIRCHGHQGHLFKDGPQPTGERWCNNGVALHFVPTQPDATT